MAGWRWARPLSPRPAWAGTLFGQGRADSSPQSVLDAPIDWRTALSTRGNAGGIEKFFSQITIVVEEKREEKKEEAKAPAAKGKPAAKKTSGKAPVKKPAAKKAKKEAA